jgi:acetolactate synthase small subunit
MSKHTLAVLVENSPGVLARVAGLFSRRAYNIDSLAVGPTENPAISRMTIVINVEVHSLEQVIRQLDKLVNVIHIAELKPDASVQAELILVKISATSKNRFDVDAVLEILKSHYAAQEIDLTDGVKIYFDKEWVHLRKSNTEPIVRIYSEAQTKEKADALAQEIIDIAQKSL